MPYFNCSSKLVPQVKTLFEFCTATSDSSVYICRFRMFQTTPNTSSYKGTSYHYFLHPSPSNPHHHLALDILAISRLHWLSTWYAWLTCCPCPLPPCPVAVSSRHHMPANDPSKPNSFTVSRPPSPLAHLSTILITHLKPCLSLISWPSLVHVLVAQHSDRRLDTPRFGSGCYPNPGPASPATGIGPGYSFEKGPSENSKLEHQRTNPYYSSQAWLRITDLVVLDPETPLIYPWRPGTSKREWPSQASTPSRDCINYGLPCRDQS